MNDTVSVEIDGKTYEGRYTIQSKTVTVSTAYGQTTTQIGADARSTARMLLRELVQAELQRKDSMLK